MEKKDADIVGWVKGGASLYTSNFVTLFVGGILTALIGAVTFGILAGPMFAGYFRVVLRLANKSEPRPGIGDVFSGFDVFLHSLLFIIGSMIVNIVGSTVLDWVPLIGGLLSIAFSLALSALLLFGIPLIADKKLDVIAAVQTSIDAVKESLPQYIGFAVVASLLGFSGVLLLGVGVVLTLPMYVASIAVAYRDVFGSSTTPVAEPVAGTA
ncbi:MAG: hypothetical protein KDD69_09740 [Bdellovibrionales bacterium]|nr:hypothetical protein [Bdellovibrionales bacterium]